MVCVIIDIQAVTDHVNTSLPFMRYLCTTPQTISLAERNRGLHMHMQTHVLFEKECLSLIRYLKS